LDLGRVGDVLLNWPFDEEAYRRRLLKSRAAVQQIDPKVIREEAQLMRESHPDYRFLMPDEKTQLFKENFAIQYSNWYKKHVSDKDHEKMTGLVRSTTKFLGPQKKRESIARREYSALWRRRQYADALGMTYDKFIEFAMESHLQVRRRKLPLPNQLLTGGGVLIVLNFMAEKFGDLSRQTPPVSFRASYRNQFYCGFPAQTAHRETVLNGLVTKHAIAVAIANDLAPEAEILAKCGQSAVDAAREMIDEDRSRYYRPFDNPDRSEFLQGCFRIPLVYDEHGDVCPKWAPR
jgi:hypothetical protein